MTDIREQELLAKIAELVAKNDAADGRIKALTAELEKAYGQLASLQKRMYGPRTEKLKHLLNPDQIRLFNEAETAEASEQTETREVKAHTRHIHKSKQQPTLDELEKKLPVEEEEVTLPEDQQSCPECGGPLERVGRELVRWEYEYVPPSLKLRKIFRITYKCKNDCNVEHPVFVKTQPPQSVLQHSRASASTVAATIVNKYLYALPLYRQERQWQEMGVPIPRNTLASWVIRAARDWLSLLVDRMCRELLSEPVVHSDETPLQVLLEPEGKRKHKSKKCYMWVVTTGEYQKERFISIYKFFEGRKKAYAEELLGGYKGCLQTDGYASYNGLPVEQHVLCWAHVRRKFAEVLPSGERENPERSNTVAGEALCRIARLFAIDEGLADLAPEKRKERRLQLEKPVLEALKSWLESKAVAGGGKLAEAIGYTLNHWKELTAYLENGLCALTNNICERAVRPFTIGRKNWLFSASAKGAEASAAAYSVIETCKLNGIQPYAYLKFVFTELPQLDLSRHPELLDRYMPWTDFIKEHCK